MHPDLLESGFLSNSSSKPRAQGRFEGAALGTWEHITSLRKRTMILIGMALVYILICIPLFQMQNQLVYNPGGDAITAQEMGQGWIQHKAEVGDDELMLYAKITDLTAPTVIYAHGRSETVRMAKAASQEYLQDGFNLVLPEYPGFSGTKGYPSEENLKASVEEAYRWTISQGVEPHNIIIHGNSLGAGPALHLAQKPHGYLVLTAPVASMDEIVTSWAPFYPSIIMFQPWDNASAAKNAYSSRSLVVHAKNDPVVPFEHGQRLAGILDAKFRPIEGGDHTLAYRGEVQKAVVSEIQSIFRKTAMAGPDQK